MAPEVLGVLFTSCLFTQLESCCHVYVIKSLLSVQSATLKQGWGKNSSSVTSMVKKCFMRELSIIMAGRRDKLKCFMMVTILTAPT